MAGVPTGILCYNLPKSEQSRHQGECGLSFGTDEKEQEQAIPTQ
jgi:hypothetical protein